MITEQLKNKVAAIALMSPLGFTFSPSQDRLMKAGYVVASSDTQDCIGKAGLWKVVKYWLRHPSYCIGGWRNEDGQMQYDASMIFFDLNEAVRAAISNKQRAFFNLYTGQEIMQSEYVAILAQTGKLVA